MPANIGNSAAATVATQLLNDFPAIRFGVAVGVGGGVPGGEGEDDVRLGDVIVSQPTATFGGLVQYDLGKRLADGSLERTGQLNKPPSVLSVERRRGREGAEKSNSVALPRIERLSLSSPDRQCRNRIVR
jgi:hypothetical protein